jgi:hypothetical protein
MMILEIGSETVTRTAVVFAERSQANRRGRYRPLRCELPPGKFAPARGGA